MHTPSWKQMDRSIRSESNGIELDVWQVSGSGWRFTALGGDGLYLCLRDGFASIEEACDAALGYAGYIAQERDAAAGLIEEPDMRR